MIDGKAKHSPTNDCDTNAVWVDARRAMTVTQETKTNNKQGCLVLLKISLSHRSDTQNHKTRHSANVAATHPD